jgi:WD40 repeat protein
MSWVYGIRFRDVKQFIEYISTSSEELLLYFVGKVAVIYNIKSQRQKHYTGHTLPIISIAVEGTLCATGDFGLSPEIRIWDYRSLETVQILRGDHVKGVHLVKFIAGGLLVSCGCLE